MCNLRLSAFYFRRSKQAAWTSEAEVCNIFAVHISEMDWTAMYHCALAWSN